MDFGLIKLGISVEIKRTDGRIHPAVVSGLNEEGQNVTVEWLERGETKGKEIELDAIFELNPNLFPARNSHQSPLPNRKVNGTDRSYPVKQTPRESRLSSAGPPPHAAPRPNLPIINDDNDELTYDMPDSPRHHGAGRRSPPARRIISDRGRSPGRGPGEGDGRAVSPRKGGDNDTSPTRNSGDNFEDMDAKKNAYRKKSHCVKEVERIKQRRVERRANQVALKEQIELEHDTSQPNWEFDAMIKEFRKTLEYQPLTDHDPIEDHQICVCVRKRPRNRKEIDRKESDVVTIPHKDMVIVHQPMTKVDLTKYLENQAFRFDYAFDETSTNEMIYRYTAQPLVESTFNGGMSTCFAYGQTGSGKTHTMGGDFASKGKQDCTKGIYLLAAANVFQLLNSKYRKLDLIVGASFFEIYSGKVFDLLNAKSKLRVLEDGKQQVQVVGLKEEEVSRVEDVLRLVQHGNNVRTSGVTSANNHSSRSHAVFQIILRKRSNRKLHGKFSLIDLAGNERGADTSTSDRPTQIEGAEINKSLLALKECIRALGRKGAHLPFRASKLTQVLRDSFIGENSRTCMIAMISPGMGSCEHTLNTLRYADRVKELGPGGPGDGGRGGDYGNDEGRGQDYGLDYDNGPGLQQQKSDLALLRNANREELPEDLYEFHEFHARVQDDEESIIDEHRELIEMTPAWLDEAKRLHSSTNNTSNFDSDVYARQLDALLANRIEAMANLREKVINFRKELQEEEYMSRNMTK